MKIQKYRKPHPEADRVRKFYDRDGLLKISSLLSGVVEIKSSRKVEAITGLSFHQIKKLIDAEESYWPHPETILQASLAIPNPATGKIFDPWELFAIAVNRPLAQPQSFTLEAFTDWLEQQDNAAFLSSIEATVRTAIENRISELSAKERSPIAHLLMSQIFGGLRGSVPSRAAFALSCGMSIYELRLILDGGMTPIPDRLWEPLAAALSTATGEAFTVAVLKMLDSERVERSGIEGLAF